LAWSCWWLGHQAHMRFKLVVSKSVIWIPVLSSVSRLRNWSWMRNCIAVEIGNMKAWYPPVTVIDFKVRPGRPVVLKVTNNSTAEHGFQMTDAANSGSPFVMKAEVVLKPGETKYIGVPTSDMFYATQGNTLTYRCHLHPAHVGGKILMIK
jgi:hypothetical protein